MPLEYTIIPENNNRINRHQFGLESYLRLDPDFDFVERGHEFGYQVEFKNSSNISLGLENSEIDLRYPFSFTESEPLPVGRYKANRIGFEYNSDERKKFNYEFEASTGGFYNGQLHQVEVEANYRQQP